MSKRGPLLAAGAGVLVIVVMVAGLILPKASGIRAKQAEVEQARTEESALRLRLEQLQAAKDGAKSTRKNLAALDAQVPPTADLPGLIRLLNTTAAQADVDFLTLAPGQPAPDATGRLSVVPIQVTVIGRFFAVDEYLFLLEDLPRVSKVLSIDLGPGPDNLPQLQVNASVEFYTTDVSAGPGSIPGHTAAQITPPSQPGASVSPAEGTGPTPTPGA
jgi:Tfp pilus assembly protein PilO